MIAFLLNRNINRKLLTNVNIAVRWTRLSTKYSLDNLILHILFYWFVGTIQMKTVNVFLCEYFGRCVDMKMIFVWEKTSFENQFTYISIEINIWINHFLYIIFSSRQMILRLRDKNYCIIQLKVLQYSVPLCCFSTITDIHIFKWIESLTAYVYKSFTTEKSYGEKIQWLKTLGISLVLFQKNYIGSFI